MKNIWLKLKALNPKLKSLNNTNFRNMSQKNFLAEEDFQITQEQINTQYTDQSLEKKNQLLINLDKWSQVEESEIKQQARVKQINLGDASTKYFSDMVKYRT